MPRGHEHDPIILASVFMCFSGQFSFKFSQKKIVKWDKNIVVPCLDEIMITFLPINNHFFAQKACVNTERVPPGHLMILLKSNKLNMAAVSVKRSIGHENYFLVTSYNTSCDVCTIIERRNVMSGISW